MSQAIMHRHEPDRLLNPVKLLGEVAGETGLLRAFWDNGQVAFCWRTPDTDGAYRVAAEIYGVDGRRWAPLLDFDDDKLSLRSMTRDENREAVNPRGAVRADKRDGNSMARQRGFDLFGSMNRHAARIGGEIEAGFFFSPWVAHPSLDGRWCLAKWAPMTLGQRRLAYKKLMVCAQEEMVRIVEALGATRA